MAQMAKNRQRAGEIWNVANIQIGCRKWPLGESRFGEIGNNFGKICEIDENTPTMKLVMSKLGT